MSRDKGGFVTFRVGWLLVAVGLACGILAGFMLVRSIGPALNDSFLRQACTTPCSELRDLDAGHYVVFEQTGNSTRFGPVTTTQQGPTSIGPSDVTVTSPTGQALEVTETNSSETINRNGTIYTGVVTIQVSESGRYRVSIRAPGETRVLLAPGIGQTLAKALPGIGAAALGGLIGGTGTVVLIVAWVRRRKVDQPAA